MKNLIFDIVNTDVIDNYELYNKESESVLLQGVINRVNLKITLKDNPEIFMPYSVMLNIPKLDSFLEIEDVSKANVLKWAVDSISDNQKEAFEKSLIKRKEGKLPTTRQVKF